LTRQPDLVEYAWERQRPQRLHQFIYSPIHYSNEDLHCHLQQIDVGGNLANVTYKGGKEYVYEIAEPDAWTTALEAEIAKPDGSVGRFVNRSIREDESLRVVVTA